MVSGRIAPAASPAPETRPPSAAPWGEFDFSRLTQTTAKRQTHAATTTSTAPAPPLRDPRNGPALTRRPAATSLPRKPGMPSTAHPMHPVLRTFSDANLGPIRYRGFMSEVSGVSPSGAPVSYAGRGRRPCGAEPVPEHRRSDPSWGREAAVQIRMIDVPKAPSRAPSARQRRRNETNRRSREWLVPRGSPGISWFDCGAVGNVASSTARSGTTSRRCSTSSSPAIRRGSHRRREDRWLPRRLRPRPLA